jgi:3-phosphoinositide dependent protein kinase-1
MCYKSSDLWALGCIIYQMITGKFPFRGQTDLVTFEKILGGHITFPKNFPEDAKVR